MVKNIMRELLNIMSLRGPRELSHEIEMKPVFSFTGSVGIFNGALGTEFL